MEANRVAREIENEDSKGNRHCAEERGQLNLRDNDHENEETQYGAFVSSVQPRSSEHNSFGKKGETVKQKQKNTHQLNFNSAPFNPSKDLKVGATNQKGKESITNKK